MTDRVEGEPDGDGEEEREEEEGEEVGRVGAARGDAVVEVGDAGPDGEEESVDGLQRERVSICSSSSSRTSASKRTWPPMKLCTPVHTHAIAARLNVGHRPP